MTTKLLVFNQALRLLGERRLTSTSEARDARYHLDDAYSDALGYCLEQGYWNFAMRAVSCTDSDTLTVAFGYAYAFEKPSDWVRTYLLSDNGDFLPALLHYNDEAGVWYADITPLYAKYVSNDSSYGADLGLWPDTFSYYVSTRLAVMAGPSISTLSDTKMDDLLGKERRARIDARSKDAMNEPPLFPPRGSWSQARFGRPARPRSSLLGH